MKITDYHAKYFAHDLTLRHPAGSTERVASVMAGAQVDLNPHQVEAAVFAFDSPLSKGALLADEVGLGKTIEAGLVLAQKWAERKRRLLVITPANLRKQWHQELSEKFLLPCTILETKPYNEARRRLQCFSRSGCRDRGSQDRRDLRGDLRGDLGSDLHGPPHGHEESDHRAAPDLRGGSWAPKDETADTIYMIEVKQRGEIEDATVLAKRKAAEAWCKHASDHNAANGGKAWRYVLVPHDVIAENMTLKALVGGSAVPA